MKEAEDLPFLRDESILRKQTVIKDGACIFR